MAIRLLEKDILKRNKGGWFFDKKREKWFTYELETVFKGERRFWRGFKTEKLAQEFLDNLELQEKLVEIGVVSHEKYPTVRELFDKRLADIENKAESVRANRVFDQFCAICGDDLTIDQVSKSHFKQFADARLAELSAKPRKNGTSSPNAHKKTVNREINPIAKAFSSVTDYYPLKKYVKPKIFRFSVTSASRNRLLEPKEIEKLLEYFFADRFEKQDVHFLARRRSGLIFHFGLMSGLRHGEIRGMRKDKLDRVRREINVFRPKGDRWKLYSPLTDTHLALLDQGAELYPESDYFFSTNGKLHNKFYLTMKTACTKLGISYGKFEEGGFIMHDTRHTFASVLHRNMIDNKTSIEFTDNPSAISDYQHTDTEAKQRAMNIIEKTFGNNQNADETLKTIFERVRAKKMSFSEFKKRDSYNCRLTACRCKKCYECNECKQLNGSCNIDFRQ